MTSDPVLHIHLSAAGYGKQTVLSDLTLDLNAGECLGMLGTSGAGKSTFLLAILGLLPWRGGWARGEVRFAGQNLLTSPEREVRKVRGRALALVPQSPASALNPALSLHTHFEQAWRAHQPKNARGLHQRLQVLLERVHLPSDPEFLRRKPTEISVGQAQRCTLALALLHRPAVVIADEPTSALDPLTQIEVLSLLREASSAENTSLLFVSHDLLSVLRLCPTLVLLQKGHLSEKISVSHLATQKSSVLENLLQTLPAPLEILLPFLSETVPTQPIPR